MTPKMRKDVAAKLRELALLVETGYADCVEISQTTTTTNIVHTIKTSERRLEAILADPILGV